MLNNHWNLKALGEVVEFLDGKRIPLKDSERATMKGDIPYYGANGKIDSINKYIFDEPLVLLAEDGGHFGSKTKPIAYKIEGKSWVNNHAHVLKPINGLNIDFLKWSLSYYDVSKYVTGSTRVKLTKGDAMKMQIPIPDLKTQQKIANILEQADAAQQKRKQAIKLTEQFLQSAFLEMFGDPVKNEKGWMVKLFSEVGTLSRGLSKHRPRNAPFLLGGKYPLIQTGEVANSKNYITKYFQTYSEAGLKQSKMWPKGTLLITIAANIAKTGILTFDACFPDSIVGFIPNNKACVEYVQYWLSFLQKTLEDNAPESAQKNINLEILRKLSIPIPPLPLQQKFAKLVERVEQLRAKQRQSEIELDNLFNSLMGKYFG